MDATTIPNASGIYRIVHVATGRMYIGSAINLHQRQRDHFSALRRGKHPNIKLQRAFNKYAPDAFTFEILELVLVPEMLTAREQYWFDRERPFGRRGFNLAPTAGSNLGMKASLETREKLRVSHLGQPGHWTGKKRSPESVAKAAAAKRGKPSPRRPGYTHSPIHREKLRQAQLGRKYGEETRRKLAAMRTGRKQRPEAIEKTRLANLGRKNTEEAKSGMITEHAGEMKTLIVTSPSGEVFTVQGMRQFCKDHHLDRRALQRVINGEFKQHKGWTAHYP